MRKSQARALLGLTLLFLGIVSAQPPQKAIAFAQQGVEFSRQGKFKEAVASYQRALAADPSLAGLHLNLGLAYFKLGEFHQAIPEFEQELKKGPNPQAATLLAISLYGAGEFRSAAEHLKAVDDAYPGNKEVPYLLAQSYLRSKQYEAAAECFRKLLQLDPDSVQVHILLAEALDGTHRTSEAVKEFETVLRLSPKEPNAHFGLGYLQWKQKRYDDAEREFRAELAIEPRNPLALAYLADSLLKRNQDPEQAVKLLEQATAIRPGLRLAHFDLGVLRANAGERDAAIAAFREAVKLDPSKPDAHYRLARLLQQSGANSESEREFAIVKRLQKEEQEAVPLLELQRSPNPSSVSK